MLTFLCTNPYQVVIKLLLMTHTFHLKYILCCNFCDVLFGQYHKHIQETLNKVYKYVTCRSISETTSNSLWCCSVSVIINLACNSEFFRTAFFLCDSAHSGWKVCRKSLQIEHCLMSDVQSHTTFFEQP